MKIVRMQLFYFASFNTTLFLYFHQNILRLHVSAIIWQSSGVVQTKWQIPVHLFQIMNYHNIQLKLFETDTRKIVYVI